MNPAAAHLARSAPLFALACAPEVTLIGEWSPSLAQEFEAESGELSGGFSVEVDVTASNAAFVLSPEGIHDDAPGDAQARYVFTISASEVFTIWGRIRSPDVDRNRFWVRIDDQPWFQWRISVGDIWYWDDVHEDTNYGRPLSFELSAGAHELRIANSGGGAALDRWRIAPASEPPPPNTTECDPPHSIELRGVCHPSCGSQAGRMCGEVACRGRTILEAYDCDVCCRSEP